jgi:hypothetical protein
MSVIQFEAAKERVAAKPPPMSLERALQINTICADHFFYYEVGFRDRKPQSLAGISLAELLEAKRLVQQKNKNAESRDGFKEVICTCDDSYLAKLYLRYVNG